MLYVGISSTSPRPEVPRRVCVHGENGMTFFRISGVYILVRFVSVVTFSVWVVASLSDSLRRQRRHDTRGFRVSNGRLLVKVTLTSGLR